MIKLEKVKGKTLLNNIAIGSPSAWIEMSVPGGEQVLILDDSQVELRMFEGRAKDKDNPNSFDDPVTDFLDPKKYELVTIPEGPSLCIYGRTYS